MGEQDDVVPRFRERPVRPIGEPPGRERYCRARARSRGGRRCPSWGSRVRSRRSGSARARLTRTARPCRSVKTNSRLISCLASRGPWARTKPVGCSGAEPAVRHPFRPDSGREEDMRNRFDQARTPTRGSDRGAGGRLSKRRRRAPSAAAAAIIDNGDKEDGSVSEATGERRDRQGTDLARRLHRGHVHPGRALRCARVHDGERRRLGRAGPVGLLILVRPHRLDLRRAGGHVPRQARRHRPVRPRGVAPALLAHRADRDLRLLVRVVERRCDLRDDHRLPGAGDGFPAAWTSIPAPWTSGSRLDRRRAAWSSSGRSTCWGSAGRVDGACLDFLLLIPISVFAIIVFLTSDWDSSLLPWIHRAVGGFELAIVWLYVVGWTTYGVEVAASFAPVPQHQARHLDGAEGRGLYTFGVLILVPLGAGHTVTTEEAAAIRSGSGSPGSTRSSAARRTSWS